MTGTVTSGNENGRPIAFFTENIHTELESVYSNRMDKLKLSRYRHAGAQGDRNIAPTHS